MKTFLVEFRLKPGCEGKMLELFEHRGPNKSERVSFRDGWIGLRMDLVCPLRRR